MRSLILIIICFTSLALLRPQISYAVNCHENLKSILNTGIVVDDTYTADNKSSLILPEIKANIENTLKAIVYIKKNVPNLLSDALKYDYSVYEITQKALKLSGQLLENPSYKELMSTRPGLINIAVFQKAHSEQIQRVDRNAMDAVKEYLKTVLMIRHRGSHDIETSLKTSLRGLLDELHALKERGAMGVSQLIAAFLKELEKISPHLINEFKSLKTDEHLAFFKEYLPGKLSLFKRKGKLLAISKDDALILFKDLLRVTKQFEEEILLYSLIDFNGGPRSVKEGVLQILNLSVDDFQAIRDLSDYTKPKLRSVFNEDALAVDLPIHIQSAIKKVEKSLVIKSQTVDFPDREIILEEVSPLEAIMRGCVGKDCSTQLSYPYPMNPFERVFFVKNANKYKAYVNTITGEVNGKKALYIQTIAGNLDVSALNLIFHTFFKIKKNLGVELIVIPDSTKLEGLLNKKEIIDVFLKWGEKSKMAEFYYLDSSIRKIIEEFHRDKEGSFSSYDLMENNKFVQILRSPIEASSKMNFHVYDSLKSSLNFENIDINDPDLLLNLALSLAYTPSYKLLANIFSLGLNETDFFELQRLLEREFRSVDDFKKEIFPLMGKMGVDAEKFYAENTEFFYAPLLLAQDALSLENEKKSIELILYAMEKEDMSVSSTIRKMIREKHVLFYKSRAFQNRILELIREKIWLARVYDLVDDNGGLSFVVFTEYISGLSDGDFFFKQIDPVEISSLLTQTLEQLIYKNEDIDRFFEFIKLIEGLGLLSKVEWNKINISENVWPLMLKSNNFLNFISSLQLLHTDSSEALLAKLVTTKLNDTLSAEDAILMFKELIAEGINLKADSIDYEDLYFRFINFDFLSRSSMEALVMMLEGFATHSSKSLAAHIFCKYILADFYSLMNRPERKILENDFDSFRSDIDKFIHYYALLTFSSEKQELFFRDLIVPFIVDLQKIETPTTINLANALIEAKLLSLPKEMNKGLKEIMNEIEKYKARIFNTTNFINSILLLKKQGISFAEIDWPKIISSYDFEFISDESSIELINFLLEIDSKLSNVAAKMIAPLKISSIMRSKRKDITATADFFLTSMRKFEESGIDLSKTSSFPPFYVSHEFVQQSSLHALYQFIQKIHELGIHPNSLSVDMFLQLLDKVLNVDYDDVLAVLVMEELEKSLIGLEDISKIESSKKDIETTSFLIEKVEILNDFGGYDDLLIRLEGLKRKLEGPQENPFKEARVGKH